MGEIYTKAVKCVAWLGPSNEQLDKMIDSLPDMHEKVQTYKGLLRGVVPLQVFVDHGVAICPPSV
jgi:hypothetical protein